MPVVTCRRGEVSKSLQTRELFWGAHPVSSTSPRLALPPHLMPPAVVRIPSIKKAIFEGDSLYSQLPQCRSKS